MQSSNMPARFPIPFANNAGASYIRTIPQAHQTPSGSDAPASLYDGFPPETFTPVGSGGVPPNGKDFNGLLNQATAWCRWQAAGGAAMFDSTFATAIGGYPKYAVLASTTPGRFWQSTTENNTTDPDGGSPSGWVAIATAPSGNDNILYHPDGKLEQWGVASATSTSEITVAVSLLTPFANASYNIQLTPIINSASATRDTWVQIISSSKTTSGFSAQYQTLGTFAPGIDGFEWRCIGKAP